MMIYFIIGLLAWNIILTYHVFQIDRGCKRMFRTLVDAVNLHSKIFSAMIDDQEESMNKRIH